MPDARIWDIAFVIDTGGEYPFQVDIIEEIDEDLYKTFQITMSGNSSWIATLDDLHGQLAGDCIPILKDAVNHIEDSANLYIYKGLERDCRTVTFAWMVDFIYSLYKLCLGHPKTTISVTAYNVEVCYER